MAKKKTTRRKSAKKTVRKKGEAPLQEQPQMKKLLALIGRKSGISVSAAAEDLGGLEEHTVRSAVSRLRNECGFAITTLRKGRKVTYHLEAKGA